VGNPETLRPQRGRAPVTRGGKDELGPAGLDAIAARNYCRKAESKRLPEERGRGRRDRGCRRPGRHGRRWPMAGECSAAAAAVRRCGDAAAAGPQCRGPVLSQ
jgi:hypothetical protein